MLDGVASAPESPRHACERRRSPHIRLVVVRACPAAGSIITNTWRRDRQAGRPEPTTGANRTTTRTRPHPPTPLAPGPKRRHGHIRRRCRGPRMTQADEGSTIGGEVDGRVVADGNQEVRSILPHSTPDQPQLSHRPCAMLRYLPRSILDPPRPTPSTSIADISHA